MADASAERYDVLILGSGQGGNPLSTDFVEAGRRVALVERSRVGGTCLNYGCTPTKTMAASAQRAWQARHAAEMGIDAGPVRVALDRVVERKRRLVEEFRRSSERRFASGEPELVRGEARFLAPHEIAVQLREGGERRLQAETIVIDTGSSPSVPPVEGLGGVPFLDNVSLMELEAAPEHLLILGGGYEAVEFGQMFRRFGSEVTLIERGPQLLAQEDEEIADALAAILEEEGVRVLTGAAVARVTGGPGRVAVEIEAAAPVTGSHLLVAAGRLPNTPALHLEAAGIATDDRGFVVVDEWLRTTAAGVYAIGDVKGGPAFTHVAYDDYRILRDTLIRGEHARSTAGRPLLYVVYTDPQLGRIGMTEREARRSGRRIRVARMPASSIARAAETGQTRGMLKAIVDAPTGQILGCAMLAAEGGELMSMIQIAMMGGLPYGRLEDAMLAHPSYAEALNPLWSHFDGE